jgi:dCMP deaminase
MTIGEDYVRPSMDEVLMHIAYAVAARGTCPYNKVGSTISRDGRVLTTGYNGAPAGMDHCSHGPRDPENVVPCTTAVHAETNAIAFAARWGVALGGAVMHTTLSPCRTCAQLIINAGISRVVCDEVYRDPTGIDLLVDAGVDVDVSWQMRLS